MWKIDLSHRSNLAPCPLLSDSWLLPESLAASRISLLSQCRMETLPPLPLFVDAAPDPGHLPAVMSFSCLANSLILWSWCYTCASKCTTSDFRLDNLSCQHSHLSLDPPSRGVIAPLIAATIAFASNDTCKTRATSVIVLQRPCTTARVEDVADLSACSRGSSAQRFFESVRAFQHSQLLVFCSRDLLAPTDPAPPA